MKVAFILSSLSPSPTGGVKIQALMWKEGLEKIGHHIDLINFWDKYEWGSYDAIIIFGFSGATRALTRVISRYNKNLIIAPIIDPEISLWKYKILTKWWGNEKYLHLSSRYHDLYLIRDFYKLWLVRSEEEYIYVNKCYHVPSDRILKVPLHFRIPIIKGFPKKENFCLHVSRLDEPIKNVSRLIEAAKKFQFQLKLVGNLQGENGHKWLKDSIGSASNIEYLGLVSDEELQKLYARAKVFALPSLVEGVGMVALEAAAYGAEIVLTNYGAPKEYYAGRALLVDPKNIDEIGSAIKLALDSGFSQPKLKDYIEGNYSESACMQLLSDTIRATIHINNDCQ